mgnify:CR=1 FL=1
MLTEPALIAERPARNGPLTSALYQRALMVYASLVALGLALFVLGTSFWQGFGLGLLLPGGGFVIGFTSVSSAPFFASIESRFRHVGIGIWAIRRGGTHRYLSRRGEYWGNARRFSIGRSFLFVGGMS